MANKEWKAPKTVADLYEKEFPDVASKLEPAGNAPVAGARTERELPRGNARFQLYSLATPNGQKVGIVMEELGLEYDAHVINIMKGDQFTSGFVKINPNSKIPALVDTAANGGDLAIMESGGILLYLAEQTGKLLPKDPRSRVRAIQWLFWQMGSQAPYIGQFNHFFSYAPRDKVDAIEYGVERYGMETQRLLSVLENELKENEYIAGDEYTIADIAIWPWVSGTMGRAGEFLQVEKYPSVRRWVDQIAERDAVKRGMTVCNFAGVAKPWLEEAK